MKNLRLDQLSLEMLDATEKEALEKGFRFVTVDPRSGLVMGSLDEGEPIPDFFRKERERRQ